MSTSLSGNHGSRTNQCMICSRHFSRKDILSRHMQIHDERRPPPTSRKKSCASCIKSKIKCQAGQPACSTCLKRGSTCVYEPPTPKRRMLASSVPPASLSDANNVSPVPGHGNWGLPSPSSGQGVRQQNGATLEYSRFPPLEHARSAFSDFTNALMDSSHFEGLDMGSESNLGWIFGDPFDQTFSVMAEPANLGAVPVSAEVEQYDTGTLDATEQDRVLEQGYISPLPDPAPHDRCPPNDPWPMEWHSTPAPCLVLPKLGGPGEDIHARFYLTIRIGTSLSATLQQTLQLPMQRSPWQAVTIQDFPDEAKLNHCIDMYFVHFQQILPIIHRPTFDPGRFPLVTLTMACIGACYTAFEGAREFSDALSEFNRRLLVYMAEVDPRFVRTESYVTAQLLQGTHGFCSGSKRLFECSESWRSSLVHNTKCMGLFRERNTVIKETSSVTERWHAWLTQERLRRLAWAVYAYVSSASYMHNLRPYISVCDVQMLLPSSQAHWEAESAQAWASLHPWTDVPRSTPFRDAMSTFFDPSHSDSLAKLTDERHRHLIILTLMRMLWTLKEIKGSPICKLVDLDDHQSRDQRDMLKVLDTFQRLENTGSDSPGFLSMEIARRYQLVHLAHFFAAGDLMDWLYPLLRGGAEAARAKGPMLKWAEESPSRIRELAYHSAQVLAVIRKHPSNLPLEAFNAFHAGVVLWCMASLLPQDVQPQAGRTVIRLDQLAGREADDSSSQRDVDSWIHEGGPYIVGAFGVPILACPAGSWQVLEQTADVLRGMRVWGIAQNFLNVITELLGSHRNGEI